MANKDFRACGRFLATAFTGDGGSSAFLAFKIGQWSDLLVEFHLTPDEARQLASILEAAALFATGPRLGTAADLGVEALP